MKKLFIFTFFSTIHLIFMENASWRHNNVFERRRVFEGRRRQGVCVQLNIYLFCVRHLHGDSFFASPSKRCQDPCRFRVVRTYLRGGVWRWEFSSDKKDAKIFKKIVGATNLVMEINEASQKLKKHFIFTVFFAQESHTYMCVIFFFLYLGLYCKNRFTFTPLPSYCFFRYCYQFSSLSGVSILGRAIVAIAGSGLILIRTTGVYCILFRAAIFLSLARRNKAQSCLVIQAIM